MIQKPFYYLWSTQTTSNAADVIYTMALTVLVLDQTNSLISAVLVPLLRSGAQMLSGLLAPLMLSKYRLPRLLLLSQVGQFLLFVLLSLYLWKYSAAPVFGIVFVLIFVMSFLDGWTTPVRNALVPRLVTQEQGLLKANSLLSVSDQIVQFAGWGLSGLIVSQLGAGNTLLLAAVMYGVAAIFTLAVREPEDAAAGVAASMQAAAHEAAAAAPASSKWHTLTEGWKLIWRTPRLRVLTFMDMIDMLGGSVWVGAFTLAFVQVALGQGEEWWGFINASYFAGTVSGGFLVLALVRKIGGRFLPAMLTGMAGYGLLTAVYAVNSKPSVALVLVLLMGPFAELAVVNRRTLIQQSADRNQLPKVLSAQSTLLALVFCISLLGMAWLAELLGIVNLYLFAAVLTLLALVVGVLYRKAFASQPLGSPAE
ncbi:MFS transporter [Paenibacillus sp. CAA11]|uniref:MFS transporter n=1 Tax=Paenibacillus sp. CAA11 TaxID=1532905 RepID=UPI000D39500D|nr:MFS transporter [Paenibacillus sp. CAA11]